MLKQRFCPRLSRSQNDEIAKTLYVLHYFRCYAKYTGCARTIVARIYRESFIPNKADSIINIPRKFVKTVNFGLEWEENVKSDKCFLDLMF